ncbi:MAG TPA: ABC transporter substrate-binding protein [Acidimicrobiales bacterium]|nr:ABC transporter substrate-binding protein [Acidimicrobiales bacterium]
MEHQGGLAAFRVGILNDMSDGPPGPGRNIEQWLRLAVDDVTAEGRLDRPFEFVHSWGLGLPTGTAAAVERAFIELVHADVLLVVGPAIGDNALVATPLAGRYRLPTINWAGTERARGEYMFHLQVGSHEDESIVIARHLRAAGSRRVGVVHDRSPIGRRYAAYLRAEAEAIGLSVTTAVSVPPVSDDAEAETAAVLGAGVDSLVYLGLGLAAPAVGRAADAQRWDGTRIMNTAGMRGYSPGFAASIDGWLYVDMHSDGNRTLAEVRRRAGVGPESGAAPASGSDMGRLVAEAFARATEWTREGVKDGLEQVKWLPAAQGHEGTTLGFGHHDRGALHGRYLVIRQWRDGSSVEM